MSDERSTDRMTQWSVVEDDRGVEKIRPAGIAMARLNAGAYRTFSDFHGPYLAQYDLRAKSLVRFNDAATKTIMQEIRKFRSSKDRYAKMGIQWQRGILLHGPQGTGKTSIIALLAQDTIASGGVALFVSDPTNLIDIMPVIRLAEHGRPFMVVLEDIDSILNDFEEELLGLLDGTEATGEGILYIGTTNYIDDVPARIRDRPSRFDTVVEIPYPNAESRRRYLNHVIPSEVREAIDIEEIVKRTAKMPLSHLKEVAVLVYVYEKPIDFCVEKLKAMREDADEEGDDAEE